MVLLSVVALYVAAIIGAGFASGQEIMVFFVQYGRGGFIGILLAAVLFTCGAWIVLTFCKRHNISSYQHLFQVISPSAALYFDWLYTFFLVVGTSVMFAGARSMGDSPSAQLILGLATPLLVAVVLQRGVERILGISTPLALVMVVILAVMVFYNIKIENLALPQGGSWQGLEAALLYVSYNLGFTMALLASVQHLLDKGWQILLVALLGNLILVGLLILLYFGLANLPQGVSEQSFPLQSMATSLGPVFVRSYRLVLWLAMYTTALANSLSLVKRITHSGAHKWSSVAIPVVFIPFVLSFLGFRKLISWAYPLLGLAGLWIMANLLFRFFKQPKIL